MPPQYATGLGFPATTRRLRGAVTCSLEKEVLLIDLGDAKQK